MLRVKNVNELVGIDQCNCWEAFRRDGFFMLDVDLYVCDGEYWVKPEDAAAELADLIAKNPGAVFEGETEFEGVRNLDDCNAENCFGVFFVEHRFGKVPEAKLAYGERIYDVRKLAELKQAMANYICNDSEAAEPGYVADACAQAGFTAEMLRIIGLDDIANEIEANC